MKQLQEDGEIAYFEKRGSSLLLYWTNVPAGFEKEVAIAFVGSVPGHFSAPPVTCMNTTTRRTSAGFPDCLLTCLFDDVFVESNCIL